MIRLNLQIFAKSASYIRQYRKSKAVTKYANEASNKTETKTEEPKQEQEKKHKPGEAVSAVSPRETYEVYRIENGKETLVATRTGEQVLDKMKYNKSRETWISNKKGLKYRVRKRT